jgi:hypothetical protein
MRGCPSWRTPSPPSDGVGACAEPASARAWRRPGWSWRAQPAPFWLVVTVTPDARTAVQPGPQGRRVPVQPLWRRAAAIWAAVWQRCRVTSSQLYLSVRVPWVRLTLSRRVSRQRPSAGWAAVPSSSTHSPCSLGTGCPGSGCRCRADAAPGVSRPGGHGRARPRGRRCVPAGSGCPRRRPAGRR